MLGDGTFWRTMGGLRRAGETHACPALQPAMIFLINLLPIELASALIE